MEIEVAKIAANPAVCVPAGWRPEVPGLRPATPTNRASQWFTIATLFLVLLVCMLVAVSLGAIAIPLPDMVSAMLGRHALSETQHTILLAVRLPRVLASSLVGASLALSGLMFQGLFRNPMADPYIIGASGGAALGACVGITFLGQISIFGFSATAMLAFAGAFIAMAIVYSLARSRGRTGGITLLLAGFAIGTMLGNSTYLFEVFDPDPSFANRIVAAWLHGVIGIPEWRQLAVTTLFFAFATLAAYPLMRRLNTLALGDEYAHRLGIRVETTRIGIILVGSLLTAIAVSMGGLISFAGLIVPHFVRMLLGPDHVRLLPVTVLAGAIFLVVTDTFARILFAPTELPVGILMVFIGGPFFLYLLRKGKREYIL